MGCAVGLGILGPLQTVMNLDPVLKVSPCMYLISLFAQLFMAASHLAVYLLHSFLFKCKLSALILI